jgi:hypothetical protein
MTGSLRRERSDRLGPAQRFCDEDLRMLRTAIDNQLPCFHVHSQRTA